MGVRGGEGVHHAAESSFCHPYKISINQSKKTKQQKVETGKRTVYLPYRCPREDFDQLRGKFSRERGCTAHDHPDAGKVVLIYVGVLYQCQMSAQDEAERVEFGYLAH